MINQSVIDGLTLGDLPSQSVGENIQKWVYEYNVKGLMSSRQDSLLMQKENFTYDNLDRLTNINQQVIISRIFKEIHMVKVRYANKPIEFIIDINAITKNPTTEVSISIGLLEGDIK